MLTSRLAFFNYLHARHAEALKWSALAVLEAQLQRRQPGDRLGVQRARPRADRGGTRRRPAVRRAGAGELRGGRRPADDVALPHQPGDPGAAGGSLAARAGAPRARFRADAPGGRHGQRGPGRLQPGRPGDPAGPVRRGRGTCWSRPRATPASPTTSSSSRSSVARRARYAWGRGGWRTHEQRSPRPVTACSPSSCRTRSSTSRPGSPTAPPSRVTSTVRTSWPSPPSAPRPAWGTRRRWATSTACVGVLLLRQGRAAEASRRVRERAGTRRTRARVAASSALNLLGRGLALRAVGSARTAKTSTAALTKLRELGVEVLPHGLDRLVEGMR